METIPNTRIMDITFTKPKGSISCNRKRGAHLYNDSLPDLTNLLSRDK